MAPDVSAAPTTGKRDRGRGAVMALDFGERRIGVAVGDRALGIGHPLETVHYKNGQDPLERIARLVSEWKPELFVVGVPVTPDGKPHPLVPAIERFCRALTERFGIATCQVDESYTSAEASDMLRGAGVRGRQQKAFLDQVAAQTILEDFFNREDTDCHANTPA
jgi:putative Holliday junction resolvase